MYSNYNRSQRILLLALLISLVAIAIVPGSTMSAQAASKFGKTSPSNGATGQSLSVTLKWETAPDNPYDHDTYYKYCYYTSNGSCDYQGVIYTTQYTISGLAKNTKYYWQIQLIYCKDSSCTEKEKYEANSGTVWSFTTSSTASDPPGAFSKLSPANNTTNLSSRVLSWQSSSGATSYQYCFSTTYSDTDCAYLGGWKDVGNVTSYTVPNDANFIWGNRYYWQIRASNAGGTTLADGGTRWTFITQDLVGKTTLISPSGIINKSVPTYRWNAVTGVTWYYLWVNNSTGNLIKQWFDATKVCSGGTCAATPSVTLNQGNYTWWVQTWNNTGYGPWSDSMAFNAPLLTPPDAPTLVSPSGDIGTNYLPTYTWNEVIGTPWYYLWVDGPSGNVIKTWYTSTDAHCNGSTCSVTPTTTLKGGAYTWKVEAWNSAGTSPWSATMSFSAQVPVLPAATTLVSPNGSIADFNPTYTWNKVSDSTWYQLSVSGPSSYAFTKWYQSSEVCGSGSTCSIAGATPNLAMGTFTWKVQTWSNAGAGPWSATMSFSTPAPAVPAATTLVSPSGSIADFNPTYTWNKVSDSTWYQLSVSGPSSYAFTKWYQSSEVCGSGSTCSIAGATPNLAVGTFTWQVQTWSSAGTGPWSATMSFSTPTPALPAAATLVSPNGSSGTNLPTYTWNEVSGSTWYYLWVDGPSGNVIQTWYTSTDAHCTSGGTCWVTPTTPLASGAQVWRIQTWNSAGVGPWSSDMNFSTP